MPSIREADAARVCAGRREASSMGGGSFESKGPAGSASCTAGPAGPAPGAAACGCEEEPAARNLGTTPIGTGTKSVASKNSKSIAEGEEPCSAYGKDDSSKMT